MNETVQRRVWRIDRAGSLNRLKLMEEPLHPPEDGEVRVAVRSVGLNFADVFACLGLYSATPQGAFIPGLEFAGVVEAVGGNLDWPHVGDAVAGGIRFGAYATHLNADARYLQALPPGWSFAEGASFFVQALTAWYAIVELGQLKPGQTVLVHSAAGGVGLLALEIVKKLGATPIATVGSWNKIPFLTRHSGLREDQIILRSPRHFGRQLDTALAAAGSPGLDLVLDSIAGVYFQEGYRRLSRGGRLVLFGAASMMPAGSRPNYARLALQYLRRPRIDPLQMISENKSVMGFNLIWLWDRADDFHRMGQELIRLGIGPPHIGARLAFDRAPDALRRLQTGRTTGKVVLEI